MPKKILLVEDNTELLELLSMNCEDAGFSTDTATNGVQALEKARQQQEAMATAAAGGSAAAPHDGSATATAAAGAKK